MARNNTNCRSRDINIIRSTFRSRDRSVCPIPVIGNRYIVLGFRSGSIRYNDKLIPREATAVNLVRFAVSDVQTTARSAEVIGYFVGFIDRRKKLFGVAYTHVLVEAVRVRFSLNIIRKSSRRPMSRRPCLGGRDGGRAPIERPVVDDIIGYDEGEPYGRYTYIETDQQDEEDIPDERY